jgi:2-haloacid dehalogenase
MPQYTKHPFNIYTHVLCSHTSSGSNLEGSVTLKTTLPELHVLTCVKEWNKEGSEFVRDSIANNNSVDWRAVDKHRIEVLPKLLAQHGLIILRGNSSASGIQVAEGSLWNDSQLKHLGLAWHRLTPWPDSVRGVELINKQFPTVSLSNTYNELLEQVVAYSKVPFKHLYSADMFHSFKPNPKVYLGAAEKMGVKPEECALVAAHLYDLKAAKALGFQAIYVERPLEEKNPELRGENIPDVWIKENENGLVTLAEHLGIHG